MVLDLPLVEQFRARFELVWSLLLELLSLSGLVLLLFLVKFLQNLSMLLLLGLHSFVPLSSEILKLFGLSVFKLLAFLLLFDKEVVELSSTLGGLVVVDSSLDLFCLEEVALRNGFGTLFFEFLARVRLWI